MPRKTVPSDYYEAHAHSMSEVELSGTIIRMAEERGWLVKPPDKANNGNGNHRAHRNGTASGFPDLVLARDGEVLFLELKTQAGKLSPEQVLWSMALPSNSGTTRYEVIRPSDLARGRVDELLA